MDECVNEDKMNENTEPRHLAPTDFDADAVESASAVGQAAPSTPPPPPAGAVASSDLQAVFDVPVKVQAVLGRSRMDIGELMRLKSGDVVELDRRVGEPVDIFVNNRMIARGEVVLIDSALGVTLTEIVRQDR
jgi:flagellar motor switch protein FliN/FliY